MKKNSNNNNETAASGNGDDMHVLGDFERDHSIYLVPYVNPVEEKDEANEEKEEEYERD